MKTGVTCEGLIFVKYGDVEDCCGTHTCGTVLEELLTLEVEEGSLLRAALGPKTRASLASLGL